MQKKSKNIFCDTCYYPISSSILKQVDKKLWEEFDLYLLSLAIAEYHN